MNDRIKKLRKVLNLTQQEFANRIGVKRNTVATYEGGRNTPVDAVTSLICKEFNVNENWLKNGTGEMFIEKSTFSLDEFAAANELTNIELRVVRGLMELKPELRNAICDVFKNAFLEEGSIYHNAPDDPEELERVSPPVGDNNVDSNIG